MPGGEEAAGHKYHPAAHRAVETSTLRKEWRDRSRWRRKDGKFPSHLVLAEEEWVIMRSATMLNDFSFPSRSWGSTKVECLWGPVRCVKTLQGSMSGGKHHVVFQSSRLGSHFRAERNVKGGCGVSHYECMNSSFYNCLWSASSLVVKNERDWELPGVEKIIEYSWVYSSHLRKESNRGRRRTFQNKVAELWM